MPLGVIVVPVSEKPTWLELLDTLAKVLSVVVLVLVARMIALLPDGRYRFGYERVVLRALWLVPLGDLVALLVDRPFRSVAGAAVAVTCAAAPRIFLNLIPDSSVSVVDGRSVLPGDRLSGLGARGAYNLLADNRAERSSGGNNSQTGTSDHR